MVVFAVTRAGRGDVFAFQGVLAADDHPLVQSGDAIITTQAGIRQSLTMPECAMLAEKLGDRDLASEIRECPNGDSKTTAVRFAMEKLWERLKQRAPQAPTDPARVYALIVADRRATRATGIHLRPRGDFSMTEETQTIEPKATETTSSAVAETAASTEKPAHRPIPKEPKFAETSVIKFGADKDGKSYGPEHNPKKPGSASADRFAKYRDGMTVKEALDAGVIRGDLDHDTKKGFITIV